jgi:IclR family acetate operon transcriptional repressor
MPKNTAKNRATKTNRSREATVPEPVSRPRRRKPSSGTISNGSGSGPETHSKAIGRALEILDLFADAETSLSLTELSGASGFPESSLFRILSTLENYRYLRRNQDGSYQLAPKVLYGTLYDHAEKFRVTIHPFLQQLNNRFDETVSLGFLFGDRIQVIDTIQGFQAIRAVNVLGRVLPPHCSSLAKVITAFQPPERIDRIVQVYGMPPHTENTITDRAALLDEYERIRQQGWAREREESAPGWCCCGAPIFDQLGRCISAISVATPTIRYSPETEEEIVSELLRIAQAATGAIRS